MAASLTSALTLQAVVSAVLADLVSNPVTLGGEESADTQHLRQPLSSHLINLNGPNSPVTGGGALTVPNPLLLQLLPPRLCANAVAMAAHGTEKVLRLVVTPTVSEGEKNSLPISSNSTQQQTIRRSLFQVGSHYNLYPMLYCSCSAFRYHCIANNCAPVGGSGQHAANNNGESGPHRMYGSAGSSGANAPSSSMVCKHLAAVAMLLGGGAPAPSIVESAESETDTPNVQGEQRRATAMPFPKDKMVNVRQQENSSQLNPLRQATTHSFDSYSLGAGASSFLVAQLQASNMNNGAKAKNGSDGLGVIEEKEISADDFIRIMGSELF